MHSSRKISASFIWLGLGIFLLAGLITAIAAEPHLIERLNTLPEVCPLKRYTGLLCGFCGMTHAWIYFWHGQLAEAFRANALSIPLFAGFPFVAVSIYRTHFWTEKRTQFALLTATVALVTYAIARNLHF